jgi:hypothetical protein
MVQSLSNHSIFISFFYFISFFLFSEYSIECNGLIRMNFILENISLKVNFYYTVIQINKKIIRKHPIIL